MKPLTLYDFKDLLKAHNTPKPVVVKTKKFKLGGSVNKIMDGVLHSRKNEIHKHPKFKKLGITPKGVPIISEDKEIIQHAEVEKNELVLHKEATFKLEEFRKEFNKAKDDSVLYKMGVYFANQIQNNTIDSKDELL
jgi:hypothetical protein